MNKQNTSKNIVFTAIATAIALTGLRASAQDALYGFQPEFPKIILQPEDQMVPIGSNAVFTVVATNEDGFQWSYNGNPLNGATNDVLTISNAQTANVGFYSCNVYLGNQSIPTRSASLMVYTASIDPVTGVDPVTVFGGPILSSGTQSTCPGPYVGYVAYTMTWAQGWGWAPDTTNGNTVFTATDTNRTNTKVEYDGEYGDSGCAQTTVTVPNPPLSPAYEFCIYFTNNVPTNAYPITLYGFNP